MAETKTDPRTHDFGPGHRCWGHDYTITKVIDGGQRLRISGWGPSMKVGEFMLLQNADRPTRYRIDAIEAVLAVDDMWHADLTFAPRSTTS